MLKMCKEEFDRLMETSPVLSGDVITKFQKTFKKSNDFLSIRKPEICNELISTENFRFRKTIDETNIDVSNISEVNKNRLQNEVIQNFKNDFSKLKGRDPNEEEIIDNLQEYMEKDDIEKHLTNLNSDAIVKTIIENEGLDEEFDNENNEKINKEIKI